MFTMEIIKVTRAESNYTSIIRHHHCMWQVNMIIYEIGRALFIFKKGGAIFIVMAYRTRELNDYV